MQRPAVRALGNAGGSRLTSNDDARPRPGTSPDGSDTRHATGTARIACGGVLLLALCLAFTPGIGAREDLGRHLVFGRLIVQTHRVPRTNCARS